MTAETAKQARTPVSGENCVKPDIRLTVDPRKRGGESPLGPNTRTSRRAPTANYLFYRLALIRFGYCLFQMHHYWEIRLGELLLRGGLRSVRWGVEMSTTLYIFLFSPHAHIRSEPGQCLIDSVHPGYRRASAPTPPGVPYIRTHPHTHPLYYTPPTYEPNCQTQPWPYSFEALYTHRRDIIPRAKPIKQSLARYLFIYLGILNSP